MIANLQLTIFLIIFQQVSSGTSAPIISCYLQKDRPSAAEIEWNLCTNLHLIGSCILDANATVILPSIKFIRNVVEMRRANQSIKLLITFTPNNRLMSQLVENATLIDRLVSDVTAYLIENSVDGFDIDWEFPVWSSDAKPTDRVGLTKLLKRFRESFNRTKSDLLLSVAVAAPFTIVNKAYDVDALNMYTDYVQIMNYDFHQFSTREPFSAFNAPLFSTFFEFSLMRKMNSDYSTRYWLKKGLLANKTVFGIPTYGRGYTLLDELMHFVYAPASGPAKIGSSYRFAQVCNLIGEPSYSYVFNKAANSAYIHGGEKQWLGFENQLTMFSKANYARELGVRGIMLFSLASDDYQGVCGNGTYPLIKAAKLGIQGMELKAEN